MRSQALFAILLASSTAPLVFSAPRAQPRFRKLVQQINRTCSANKQCVAQGQTTGNCCPTNDDTYLSCCFEDLKAENGYCADGVDNDNDGLTDCEDPNCWTNQACILAGLNPKCSKNTVCKAQGLGGLCCPTKQGEYLQCCTQALKNEFGFCADGIDNDGNGLVDCDDPACAEVPVCMRMQKQCKKNKACAALGLNKGACCPTKSGQYLDCCQVGARKSESGKCADGIDNDGDGKTDCDDDECTNVDVCIFAGLNPRCQKNTGCTSLDGLCCPTQDGQYLDCCKDSLP